MHKQKTQELKFSDPEFLKAFNTASSKEREKYKEKLEDPVRVSREGSCSATRVIDVLQKVKSPKQIKIPRETEYLIDKVVRKKMYPAQSQKSLHSTEHPEFGNKLSKISSINSKKWLHYREPGESDNKENLAFSPNIQVSVAYLPVLKVLPNTCIVSGARHEGSNFRPKLSESRRRLAHKLLNVTAPKHDGRSLQ